MGLFMGIGRWGSLRRLSRDITQLKAEIMGCRTALERIAAGIERANQADGLEPPQPRDPDAPAVEITYADTLVAQEFMDIETRLTQATGQPPTEDEIMAEFLRRHDPRPPREVS